ncbi:oxaloacetate tautomerase Fahd2a, mitochondrial isoform X1 [Bombus vancouverensis nearcticus]|uniref:Fumarylacetoacetate hydrolase domain-containing protein 2A isoform X1 n=1 Tax=Bombus bifarius TaxID=103933 RepID=A0A6P8MQR3_9HYME|nr:fumarylacetoacetate hydrolase domain-containing protein 2A isoform X1 [Bombus vancouverensis nearcticus]XP_033304795.1 fumarylacetoacetate hydrolase domain-containing protein 2A isoform X1 [Bombus bifarius]XP_050483746.1 fumarylacetoacetate hydrolase domain-containing protein 2A isoform X1 [Bombus huntii]
MPFRCKLRLISRVCLAFKNSCTEKSNSHFAASITNRNFSISGTVNMRFVQFTGKDGGPQHLGVQLVQGGDIIAVSAVDSRIPNTMKKFLEGGDDMLKKAKREDEVNLLTMVERIVAEGRSVIPETDVTFLAPVTKMDKLACVGLNYSGHCEEQGVSPPESPVIFSKFPSNIIGPRDNIMLPSISEKVDWEAELVIVIGKKCKALNKDEGEECIFGYTIAQDITARDWQKSKRNGGQFLLGKAMDTFCPMGPAIVTKEAICDINNLSVKTWVNGDIKQDGNTSELIFKPHEIVAYISQFMTLLPGDVILTGTPAGVGFARKPPEYLQRGDVLETEIEGLGRLRNKVL